MKFKIKEVLQKISDAKEHWKELYRLFDQDFTTVWETSVMKVYGSRFDPNRPQFHIQQARKYIRNLVGKARTNKPGIKISARTDMPVDALKDIVRFVESDSGASFAYMKALMSSATFGLGFLKIEHSEDAGEVPLRIRSVDDIFSAYIDPASRENDGSDAKYCFFVDTEEKTNSDGSKEEESSYQYYELSDGKCYWCQIEDEKIVKDGEFACTYLPLIPIYGQTATLGSRRVVYGEARPLKGMQDYFDYLISKNAENIALDKFIMAVPENSIKKEQFAAVARDPIPIVEYRTIAEDGETPLGPPQILRAQGNTESVMAGANLVKGAMADITGIYDASLGYSKTDAESGAAIIAKQETSDTSVNDYMDNLCISIRRLGIVLCSLIERVTADQSLSRMTGMAENGDIMNVPMMQPDGTRLKFNADNIYVSVRVGKSYDTQRDEFLDRMFEFAKLFPEQAMLASDIFAALMDFPMSKEVSRRVFNSLPPAVTGNEMVPIAQMQEKDTQIQELQNQVQQLSLVVQKNTSDALATANIKANADLHREAMRQAGLNERQIMEIMAKAEERAIEIAEQKRKENVEIILKAGGVA
ncbi:MAG: hypothetical protein LBU89_10920 [Fibromonadaceae bacterium]|jgi:hypothetical protein|nr:hypothetical protein [Fibromonadaceae bacterium]